MDTQNAGSHQRPDPEAAQQANAVLQQVLKRSTSDRGFRQRLLTEPRAAVAEFTGRPVSAIPESPGVKFVENDPGTVTVVLPSFMAPAGELSEHELEAVSGGTTILCVAILAVAIDGATGGHVSGAIYDYFNP